MFKEIYLQINGGIFLPEKLLEPNTHHLSPSLPEICEFEILHSEVSSKIESRSDSSRFWLLVITLQEMGPYPTLYEQQKSSTQTCLGKRVW